MPTAPLYYQPIVQARVLGASIPKDDGSLTTVYAAHEEQSKLVGEAYANPKYRPRMDAIMRGFEGLQAELPGSKSLDNIQFAFNNEGYIANRVTTAMRLHPELFDTASPDQAAEIGASLVKSATDELGEHPGMRAVGDVLEVAPDMTALMKAHWEGEQLGVRDAAYIGVSAARELQRSVTPLEPDATHPSLQWVEDASSWMLGMWPGAASKTAQALGLKAEAVEVEKIVDGWRSNMAMVEPKVDQPIKSLSAILGAAGITVNDKTAFDAAFQMLQGSALEGVPAGIAQGIVATNNLEPGTIDYFTGRIIETSGSAGNVKGLLAEIELAKRPKPAPPADEPVPPADEPVPVPVPPADEPVPVPPADEPVPPADDSGQKTTEPEIA